MNVPVDAALGGVQVAPLDLDRIERCVEQKRAAQLRRVELGPPRRRRGAEDAPRVPLVAAMGLQHANQIGADETHELRGLAHVGRNRPDDGRRVAILDQLDPEPLRHRGKRSHQTPYAVAKAPRIEDQVTRNSRLRGPGSQPEAMTEVRIAAQSRHHLEIRDVLAERRLHARPVDDRQRYADGAEDRLRPARQFCRRTVESGPCHAVGERVARKGCHRGRDRCPFGANYQENGAYDQARGRRWMAEVVVTGNTLNRPHLCGAGGFDESAGPDRAVEAAAPLRRDRDHRARRCAVAQRRVGLRGSGASGAGGADPVSPLSDPDGLRVRMGDARRLPHRRPCRGADPRRARERRPAARVSQRVPASRRQGRRRRRHGPRVLLPLPCLDVRSLRQDPGHSRRALLPGRACGAVLADRAAAVREAWAGVGHSDAGGGRRDRLRHRPVARRARPELAGSASRPGTSRTSA